MNITDHIVSHITRNTLYAFSDHGRTQVSDMERFCHIRSAVIDHDLFDLFRFFQTKLVCFFHLLQIRSKKLRCDITVQKARHNSLNLGKYLAVSKGIRYRICDHDRCFLKLLCQCHGSVTLQFTQIRPVGNIYLSIFCRITGFFKCLFHFFRNNL